MNIDEFIQQPGQKERLFREDIFKSLHVAVPGEVVSYDSENRTVVVQPTIRDMNSTKKPPLLLDVPVFFIGNFLFTPQKGDGCLVVFADRCIDGWFKNGGVSIPISDRSHDLSDGFAFIGFRQTGGSHMIASVADIGADSSGNIPKEDLLSLVYPVGSVYLSMNNTSPETLFGGEWSSLEKDGDIFRWNRTA